MFGKYSGMLAFVFSVSNLVYSVPVLAIGGVIHGEDVYALDADGTLISSVLSDTTGSPRSKSAVLYDAYYAEDGDNTPKLIGTNGQGNFDIVLSLATSAPTTIPASVATPAPISESLSNQDSSSSNVALIVGGTVGGVVLIASIAAGFIAYQCRKTITDEKTGKNLEHLGRTTKELGAVTTQTVQDLKRTVEE